MKEWSIKDGIPTFLAIGLLILLELLRLFGVASDSQLGRYEIICNAAMLLFVAIGLFSQPLTSKEPYSPPIGHVVGNTAVSVVSFPMNIDVFGHMIRPECLASDLWGWHIFWIACAVLNLLILSPLGRLLLAQLHGILRWAKQIVVVLGKTLFEVADYIRKSEKNILLTIIVGVILWIGCFVIPIPRANRSAVFTDMGFWGKTLLYWVLFLFTALLVNIFPGMLQKARNTLSLKSMKWVLAIIAIAAAFLVFAIAGPFLVRVLCILLVLLVLSGCIIRCTHKIDKRKFSGPRQRTRRNYDNCNIRDGRKAYGQTESSRIRVRVLDVVTLVLLFVIIPLSILFLLTLFTPAGRQLFPERLSDSAAWWNFWIAFQDMAAKFLKTLGIR